MSPHVDIDRVTGIIGEVADEFILPYFGKLKEGDIAFKIGDDPVTIADQLAESYLSKRLSGLLPGSKCFGEEGFAANPASLALISGNSPVWIIDPIDGTRNFTRGSPLFGVIVALAKQKQVLAGWIYDPTSKEVVIAEQGGGAFYKAKRLKTLPPAPLEEMRGGVGDRLLATWRKADLSTPAPQMEEMHVGAHEYPRLVHDGDFFSHAGGQLHFRASLHFSTPWDDAAGILIHRESGGYTACWDGAPYDPAILHRGFASAPDRESWEVLRRWHDSFVPARAA